MSLLMDALRKAEEAKRLAAENPPPPASASGSPTLELLPVSPAPEPSLSELASPIDPAEAQPSGPLRTSRFRESGHAQPVASGQPARDAEERSTVRNVFSAKHAPQPSPLLWGALGLAGIAALAIAGYFWWQLQAVGAKPTLARPVTSPPAAVPTPAPAQTSAAATRNQDAEKFAAELRALQTPPATPAPTPPSSLFEPPTRPVKTAAATLPAAPESPVRLSRSQPKANATLERAYGALQAGNLDEATRSYEQVLRADARNIDALLGLATLAARQGQNERAQAYYLQALEVNPRDATAQAGLISTRGHSTPARSESQLKTALDSHPDSATLHFALGNLYASQSRWSEAQQAYFRAYSAAPENPDFIFNLAVSLDHLHQNKLAIQYYQMAQQAAGNSRSIAFDPNQVRNRLLELQAQ